MIFEEFYQVLGGISDKTPGTGLGLPLSKALVEMHGGKIWVESKGEGKGSRFSFALNIEAEHLEEGKIETIEPSLIGMDSKEYASNHINKAISFFKRQGGQFSLCRFHVDGINLQDMSQEIKEALKKEKRHNDFIGRDQDWNLYLILQETDSEKAKAVCDRFIKRLQTVLENHKISCSIATFPEDGESVKHY